MARMPRYWRLTAAKRPGDPVAEHDGGVGLDRAPGDEDMESGPGFYRIVVRRPGSPIDGAPPVSQQWPIEVYLARTGELVGRFNRGMARWYGLRLIEAAALCEAYDVEGGASKSAATSEIDRLSEWIMDNAADRIKGSAVDTAVALLGEYKKASNAGEVVPPTPTERAIEDLRREYRLAVDAQQVPITLRARQARLDALNASVITPAQITSDVVGWFSPSDQTVLRGLGLA